MGKKEVSEAKHIVHLKMKISIPIERGLKAEILIIVIITQIYNNNCVLEK